MHTNIEQFIEFLKNEGFAVAKIETNNETFKIHAISQAGFYSSFVAFKTDGHIIHGSRNHQYNYESEHEINRDYENGLISEFESKKPNVAFVTVISQWNGDDKPNKETTINKFKCKDEAVKFYSSEIKTYQSLLEYTLGYCPEDNCVMLTKTYDDTELYKTVKIIFETVK